MNMNSIITRNKFIAIALLGGAGLSSFPPAATAQPVATTLAATSVTATNATINGAINPNGAAAVAYFQYGPTTNYGYLGGYVAVPATNGTFTLPGTVVNTTRGAAGTTWTQTTAPSKDFYFVASSADGTHLAAVDNGNGSGGFIYTSTNAGSTWTQVYSNQVWYSVASSADGTHLVASSFTGGTFISTNGGASWTHSTGLAAMSIASSADGMYLAAVVNAGGIYTSTNGGVTWSLTSAPAEGWSSIACSADGQYLAASVLGSGSGGRIFTSTNAGATWTQTSALIQYWAGIASSADGTRLAVANEDGNIWASSNGGVAWSPLIGSQFSFWLSVASSADGSRLTGGIFNGGIYTSINSGGNWTSGNLPSGVWRSIASSADGSQLAAVTSGGIYTSTGTVNPLTPATTYHYRMVGLNTLGTSLGDDMTFTTSLAAPTVTTLPASGLTLASATLNGAINPNGAATSQYYQYGLTMSYGSYTATNTLAATNVPLSVPSLITNLTPGATYHYQLVASNSLGTVLGGDLTVTASTQPAVTILPASGISATNATLNGTVNPNWAATAAYFQYGLTTSYGSYTATNSLEATNVALSVANLTGSLTPGTTYHFRLVASNNVGTSVGSDLTFITSLASPTIATLAATNINQAHAALKGTVNPNGGATSAYFQYGLTTNYGTYSATNALAGTNVTLSVSNLIGSLTPSTTYHFQLVAGNSAGTNAGADVFFTTLPPAVSFSLNSTVKAPGGAFQFSFTNLSGLGFTVLSTTNLSLPLSNWTALGVPVESPAGHYQFTDSQATNKAVRFYRVSSP